MPQKERRIFRLAGLITQCQSEALAYGKCVSANAERMTKDLCASEFKTFITCIQAAVKKEGEMNNIKRYKNADKLMKFYKTHFGFTEPIRVLIDGTFCLAALQNKINIAEQMPNYLQCQTRLCTSKCILRELTILGSAMYGALLVAKQFSVVKCGHGKDTTAMQCLNELAVRCSEDSESHKYMMCTQDRGLVDELRTIPGCPVIYIKYNAILMEKPSESTKKFIENHKKSQLIGFEDKNNLKKLKKIQNIKEVKDKDLLQKIVKKKVKGPNPLSCKKKKKKSVPHNNTGASANRRVSS